MWDKQVGFLKESLVVPASRKTVFPERIVGVSIASIIQALVVIAVSLQFSSGLRLVNVPIGLFYIFIKGLGFTSLGVAVSLKFSSMEGFQVIVNFLTMPLCFSAKFSIP